MIRAHIPGFACGQSPHLVQLQPAGVCAVVWFLNLQNTEMVSISVYQKKSEQTAKDKTSATIKHNKSMTLNNYNGLVKLYIV